MFIKEWKKKPAVALFILKKRPHSYFILLIVFGEQLLLELNHCIVVWHLPCCPCTVVGSMPCPSLRMMSLFVASAPYRWSSGLTEKNTTPFDWFFLQLERLGVANFFPHYFTVVGWPYMLWYTLWYV